MKLQVCIKLQLAINHIYPHIPTVLHVPEVHYFQTYICHSEGFQKLMWCPFITTWCSKNLFQFLCLFCPKWHICDYSDNHSLPPDLKDMVPSKAILFNSKCTGGLRLRTVHGMGVPGEGRVLPLSPPSCRLGGLLRHSDNGCPWCGYYRSNQFKFLPQKASDAFYLG